MKSQAARGVPDSPQLRNEVREQLIVREIIAQEATKKGLAKNVDVQAQLELARQQVLWNAYIADFIKANPIPDAQLKAEYDKLRSTRGDKEYKTRHILLEKEDEAKAVIAELKKGRKFEELAKQSKDPGSKDRGGDLDWNSPAGYVKPFGDAMVKLEKGKYTEVPVQTQFGWHVILVEDVRQAKFPTLRRDQAAAHRAPAGAGVLAHRVGSAREGEGRVGHPTQTRAFRKSRSHGLSSPLVSGRHEHCTARNTRSGCGIRMVNRPSGVVSPVMPPGDPLGLSG